MAFNVEDQSEDSLKCFPTLPRLQYAASEYRPRWFVSAIRRIHQYMKVVIPVEFGPFIFAPSEMMVTVNGGKCSYIVEVENQQLTKGWYTIALNHKLGKNYTILFASVRRHVFELFIFDEEGSRVKHELINNGLHSQVHRSIAAVMNADKCPFVTSYLPASFQASNSEHQFYRTLRKADLKEMELPNMFKAIANVSDLQQVTLITKARTWKVSCVHGYLKGEGWSTFVAAHRYQRKKVKKEDLPEDDSELYLDLTLALYNTDEGIETGTFPDVLLLYCVICMTNRHRTKTEEVNTIILKLPVVIRSFIWYKKRMRMFFKSLSLQKRAVKEAEARVKELEKQV